VGSFFFDVQINTLKSYDYKLKNVSIKGLCHSACVTMILDAGRKDVQPARTGRCDTVVAAQLVDYRRLRAPAYRAEVMIGTSSLSRKQPIHSNE
jgi:hypothetical protein